jgi:hypothetical protein
VRWRFLPLVVVLPIAMDCRTGASAARREVLTPHADSLLSCAERELFAHGYSVRRVVESALRLRADPQRTVNSAHPTIVMVEYNPETRGLDVWAPVGRTAPGALDASAEIAQVAWAVQDACTPKDVPPGDRP